jgi:uncharacterized membrane protein
MEQIKQTLNRFFAYFGKKILIYSLGISIITGLSFLFTGGFSANAYSDRLVWVGLFLVLASGIVWFGVFVAGRQFGVGTIKNTQDAKNYLANQAKIQETIESRYDAAVRIWIIGLVCIGLGALVQILAGSNL